MSCERKHALQTTIIETPGQLKNSQWQEHLHQCRECHRESKLLNNSLRLYQQLAEPKNMSLDDLSVWEAVSAQLQWKPPRQWQWPTYVAAAAVFLLLLGLGSVWYAFQGDTGNIPANYKVVDLQSGETFGSQTAQMRVVWNSQQFGLSIERTAGEGAFSAVSIALALPPARAKAFHPQRFTLPVSTFAQHAQKSCPCPGKKDV